MQRRRRRGEGVLRRHGGGGVEPSTRLQLLYDSLCDLGDELRRYTFHCLSACSVNGIGDSLVDGFLRRGWGVSILFRHH